MNDEQLAATAQLLERGNAAEQLLQSDAFQAVANTLSNQYLQSILMSAPEDTKAREFAYAQARTVQDLVGLLRQWVSVRDQIVMAEEAETYEEPESE